MRERQQSACEMSEGDVLQNLQNLQNYSSFIESKDPSKDGKKYKLRLKFDGSALLDVIRLNGGHFENLTHLDISGNSAEKLDLRNLSRLEWLCCSNNQLEILILSGTSLTFLDCSHNKLESIVVDPLPNNLSTLQLSFNNLQELPSWTWMIPELFLIHASNNRLHSVDLKFQNSLAHLPISELDLHSNKIESISKDFIQRATRLTVLNLSQNQLKTLPPFGKRCPIQELFLSRNQLTDSSDSEALEFLYESTRIKRLHLAFNKIHKVNERFTTIWKNLEELILCGNRIQSLPSKISLLTKLRVLRIHSNRLEIVPNLSKMPQLKLLDLSHNNLKKINLENLISGGNLTYLDISCNDKLRLYPEKLFNPKRPMNLVEVTNPKKHQIVDLKNNQGQDFPANPPWELGFSELPDRKQCLSVTQYRDINVNNGKEALFGIFDGGSKFTVPKSISKSIAKLYAEERNIEESLKLSLKYTLLNTLRNLHQNGHSNPTQGVLCHLSMQNDSLDESKLSFTLNLAMVGDIRCILVGPGKKVTPFTSSSVQEIPKKPPRSAFQSINLDDSERSGKYHRSDLKRTESDRDPNSASSMKSNSDISIPDPIVFSIPLTPSYEFLLIASTSVWNHVTQEEIIDELEIHRNKKTVLIAKRITELAQSHACKQSLSVLLVRFKWRSSSSRGLILDPELTSLHGGVKSGVHGVKSGVQSEYGPLCYSSGSSNYSDDIPNPLASVTTPDSAIDTDRSSGRGSFRNEERSRSGRQRSWVKTPGQDQEGDNISLANTTMSVEQFRCWEYMLEQNTRLLFKKELDTISKGVFSRNQKLRKSVQFPYAQEPSIFQNPNTVKPENPSQNPGFYTLSKAKSLSQLLSQDPQHVSGQIEGQGRPSRSKPKSHFPLFTNANAGFLESVRATKHLPRGTILSGPDAAYFGSSQRLGQISSQNLQINSNHSNLIGITPNCCKSATEITEIKCYDPIERENRLKKYWDNKVTYL